MVNIIWFNTCVHVGVTLTLSLAPVLFARRWQWLGVSVFVVSYSYVVSVSLPFFSTLVGFLREEGKP